MLAKSSTGDSLLSFSLSYTFSDSSALAFSQLAGESPRSLDRTMLFSSPQLDGGIKSLSARFIRCSGSAALGRPTHSYFTPAALTYKNLSNEITDRQPERENYKMKHWGNTQHCDGYCFGFYHCTKSKQSNCILNICRLIKNDCSTSQTTKRPLWRIKIVFRAALFDLV